MAVKCCYNHCSWQPLAVLKLTIIQPPTINYTTALKTQTHHSVNIGLQKGTLSVLGVVGVVVSRDLQTSCPY